MITLLGVGIPRERGGWLVREVSARLRPRELTIVVSSDPASRRALADAVCGRVVPAEGRVWVGGTALTPDTRRRVRSLVGRVSPDVPLAASRSVLWNTLVWPGPGAALAGLVRYPRPAARRAAERALDAVGLERRGRERVAALGVGERGLVLLARVLALGTPCLVVHDLHRLLGDDALAAVFERLRRLASAQRVCMMATLAEGSAAVAATDRVLVIAGGRLTFDGPPAGLVDRGPRAVTVAT